MKTYLTKQQCVRLLLMILMVVGLGGTNIWGQGASSSLEGEEQVGRSSFSWKNNAAGHASYEPRDGNGMPLVKEGAKIAVIPVDSEIYGFVLKSMERRVQRALDDGAQLIVFEVNTYGGAVPAALSIAKYVKDPMSVPVPTVAWINNKAYSAGILISSAMDQMVMSPSSSAGDCAPIVPGMDLSATERAKALSPILAEFKDNAKSNGYDYAPFHAMCVLGVEVYYIENPASGERHLVNQADYAWMVEGKAFDPKAYNEDRYAVGAVAYELARINDPSTKGTWEPVTILQSGLQLPGGLVHNGTTLFTYDQTLARDIGLSKATVSNVSELKEFYQASEVRVVSHTWSEDIAAFLTSPLVRGVLVMALLVGAYMEFQTPGLGVAGAVAIMALIALLGAPLVVGLSEVWHIVVFIIGFVLLIIELAFTPAFGLLGIAGIVLMLVGLVLAVVPSGGGPEFGPINLPPATQWENILFSTVSILLGVFFSLICMYFITRYFGKIPFLNRLILADDNGVAGSETVVPAKMVYSDISGDEVHGRGKIRVGLKGKAVTDLNPAGVAHIKGIDVDVMTVGNWIDKGTKIKIVEMTGNQIVVDFLE